jgi:hypothetical protein
MGKRGLELPFEGSRLAAKWPVLGGKVAEGVTDGIEEGRRERERALLLIKETMHADRIYL